MLRAEKDIIGNPSWAITRCIGALDVPSGNLRITRLTEPEGFVSGILLTRYQSASIVPTPSGGLKMKRLIVIAWAAVFAAGAITPSLAKEGYSYERTALRKSPNSNASLLAWIPEGAKIDMSNCKDGWCKVRWGGKSGYARYSSIDYTDDYEDCVYWDIC